MTSAHDQQGFTLIELLIAMTIISVVAAVAVPGLLRARASGNEAAAVGALRAVNSAEASYSSGCAPGGYAIDLADLARPPAGSQQGFISPDLSSNGATKSGYIITLARDAAPDTKDVSVATCNGAATTPASAYFVDAVPADHSGTGARYFAADTRGTIMFDTAGPIANPIPAGLAAVQ